MIYGGYLLWEEYEPLVEAIKEVSPKRLRIRSKRPLVCEGTPEIS